MCSVPSEAGHIYHHRKVDRSKAQSLTERIIKQRTKRNSGSGQSVQSMQVVPQPRSVCILLTLWAFGSLTLLYQPAAALIVSDFSTSGISLSVIVFTLCSTIGIAKHALDGANLVINDPVHATRPHDPTDQFIKHKPASPSSLPAKSILQQSLLTKTKSKVAQLRWGNVYVREMCREAGGGGAISSDGIPLGLGWVIAAESRATVADFEAAKHTRPERGDFCLAGRVGKEERERRLLEAGIPWTELVQCYQAVERVRQARSNELRGLYF